jgi:hypothetical protein
MRSNDVTIEGTLFRIEALPYPEDRDLLLFIQSILGSSVASLVGGSNGGFNSSHIIAGIAGIMSSLTPSDLDRVEKALFPHIGWEGPDGNMLPIAKQYKQTLFSGEGGLRRYFELLYEGLRWSLSDFLEPAIAWAKSREAVMAQVKKT